VYEQYEYNKVFTTPSRRRAVFGGLVAATACRVNNDVLHDAVRSPARLICPKSRDKRHRGRRPPPTRYPSKLLFGGLHAQPPSVSCLFPRVHGNIVRPPPRRVVSSVLPVARLFPPSAGPTTRMHGHQSEFDERLRQLSFLADLDFNHQPSRAAIGLACTTPAPKVPFRESCLQIGSAPPRVDCERGAFSPAGPDVRVAGYPINKS